MKRLILVAVALAASLTIPAVASANGGGGTPPPVCPQWSRTCGPVQPPYPPPYPTVLTADPIIAGSGNAEVWLDRWSPTRPRLLFPATADQNRFLRGLGVLSQHHAFH